MDREDWIPCRVVWEQTKPLIDWCYLGGARFTEPFFRQTIARVMRRPFSAAFQPRTTIEASDDATLPDPAGFIFHMSRCGSTLISQMLKAKHGVTVFSEPPPVDAIVRASEFGIHVEEQEHGDWLRRIVRALSAQARRPYFLKLDCWHAIDLELFRRVFPSVPWIFVYRDPVEVLASHAAEPGEWTDRNFLNAGRFGFDPTVIPPAALSEYRTHLLAGIFRSVLEYGELEGHLVNYSQIPDWGWTTLPRIFGLNPTAQEIAAMQDVAAQDVKRSTFTFAPDSERKRSSAAQELHALSQAHLCPLYLELETRRLKQS
jgi:hypothetical protein